MRALQRCIRVDRGVDPVKTVAVLLADKRAARELPHNVAGRSDIARIAGSHTIKRELYAAILREVIIVPLGFDRAGRICAGRTVGVVVAEAGDFDVRDLDGRAAVVLDVLRRRRHPATF